MNSNQLYIAIIRDAFKLVIGIHIVYNCMQARFFD